MLALWLLCRQVPTFSAWAAILLYQSSAGWASLSSGPGLNGSSERLITPGAAWAGEKHPWGEGARKPLAVGKQARADWIMLL